ncbi:hypothetical protein EB118_00025 [bacterium]|nr:hypothetical protein [bacterium]
MRYLRRTHLNPKTVTGRDSFYIDISGEAVINSRFNLTLPRGTNEDQSPDDSTAATFVNGMIRYNTETNQFEGYQAGSWRSFRFKEPGAIQYYQIGTGNAVETTFRLPFDPFVLTPQSNLTWDRFQIAKNLIVLVENVIQIANVNYEVVQNPSSGPGAPYVSGTYVKFGTAVPNAKPINVITGFDR